MFPIKAIAVTACKAGRLLNKGTKLAILQEAVSQGHKLYQKRKGTENTEYVFCQSVQCPAFIKKECCIIDDQDCLYTVKYYQHWLQSR